MRDCSLLAIQQGAFFRNWFDAVRQENKWHKVGRRRCFWEALSSKIPRIQLSNRAQESFPGDLSPSACECRNRASRNFSHPYFVVSRDQKIEENFNMGCILTRSIVYGRIFFWCICIGVAPVHVVCFKSSAVSSKVGPKKQGQHESWKVTNKILRTLPPANMTKGRPRPHWQGPKRCSECASKRIKCNVCLWNKVLMKCWPMETRNWNCWAGKIQKENA